MHLIDSILTKLRMKKQPTAKRLGRHKVRDVAIQYRVGAGVAGTVSRMNPAAVIEPTLVDPTNPPTGFGQAVNIAAASQGARIFAAADTFVYGITVRVYPFQQQSGSLSVPFGNAGIDIGALNVLRSGYIMVPIVGTPVKGGVVYVWIGAAGGGHAVGDFEAVNGAGNTIALPNPQSSFQGGVDANGIGEIAFNV